MKRMTLLLVLVIVAMVSNAKDRTGYINTGQTILNKPMAFDANDTIKTSETVNIVVYSEQLQPSKQDFYLTLGGATGSPSVAVTAYGKCFAGDAYVQIGSPVTWTSTGNNPVKIAAAAPNQYRYYKIALVHSGAVGTAKITAFEMKLWLTGGLASAGTLTDGTMTINSGAIADATTGAFSGRITGTGGATISGAATNINASSNFATNIGTGTTNAAITIGGGSNTVAVNSSDWDISTTGVMTGIGAITADGLITGTAGAALSGAAINLNASSNYATNIGTGSTDAAVSIGGGSNTVAVNSSSWDISTAGAVSGVTTIAASGNIVTTKKVAAADSLCLNRFMFIVISDTLCAKKVDGTILRLFPSRP